MDGNGLYFVASLALFSLCGDSLNSFDLDGLGWLVELTLTFLFYMLEEVDQN